MKLCSVFIMSVFIFSCAAVEVNSPQYNSLPVRDIPLEARKDDVFRKKILVLPILSKQLDPVTSRQILDRFKMRVDEVGYYKVVSAEELGLNWEQFVTKENKYNVSKIARSVEKHNIPAFVLIMVEDLKYYRIGDKLGVLRRIETKLDARTRVAVISTSTEKSIFKALKESSVTMNDQVVASKPHQDKKLMADPQMAEMAVSNALEEVVPKMSTSLGTVAWEGRVARIEGEKVYLNVGRQSGVQVGDILKVTGVKQDVFDPQKGEFLGKSPGRVKGMIEVKAYLGENGSIAVIYSGAGFAVNDRVEVY